MALGASRGTNSLRKTYRSYFPQKWETCQTGPKIQAAGSTLNRGPDK